MPFEFKLFNFKMFKFLYLLLYYYLSFNKLQQSLLYKKREHLLNQEVPFLFHEIKIYQNNDWKNRLRLGFQAFFQLTTVTLPIEVALNE